MSPAKDAVRSFNLDANTLATIENLGDHFPGGFFIYEAAAPERLLYANDIVFEIFGCKDLEEFKELTGYTFKGMLHPDDYEANTQSIEQQIAGSHNKMDHVIYRIIRKDGEVRWIDDYGHYAVTEEHGGVYYVFISDITESRLKMEQNEAVHTAVIDALCDAYETVFLITDIESESVVLYRSSASTPITHVKQALNLVRYTAIKEDYVKTMVAAEDRAWFEQEVRLQNVIAKTAVQKRLNITYRRISADHARYYSLEFIRVNLPNGKLGIIYGFKDIDADARYQHELQEKLHLSEADRAKTQEELSRAQQAAMIDPMTGVKNKRCYSLMEQEVNRKVSEGSCTEYAIVFCDINGLKTVNDVWGHMSGDKFIKAACMLICQTFKHSPVYRLGGDEFAVVLIGSDFAHRFVLMQQMAEKVHENAASGGLVVASGIAEYTPGKDPDFAAVAHRADREMYANKQAIKEKWPNYCVTKIE